MSITEQDSWGQKPLRRGRTRPRLRLRVPTLRGPRRAHTRLPTKPSSRWPRVRDLCSLEHGAPELHRGIDAWRIFASEPGPFRSSRREPEPLSDRTVRSRRRLLRPPTYGSDSYTAPTYGSEASVPLPRTGARASTTPSYSSDPYTPPSYGSETLSTPSCGGEASSTPSYGTDAGYSTSPSALQRIRKRDPAQPGLRSVDAAPGAVGGRPVQHATVVRSADRRPVRHTAGGQRPLCGTGVLWGTDRRSYAQAQRVRTTGCLWQPGGLCTVRRPRGAACAGASGSACTRLSSTFP